MGRERRRINWKVSLLVLLIIALLFLVMNINQRLLVVAEYIDKENKEIQRLQQEIEYQKAVNKQFQLIFAEHEKRLDNQESTVVTYELPEVKVNDVHTYEEKSTLKEDLDKVDPAIWIMSALTIVGSIGKFVLSPL